MQTRLNSVAVLSTLLAIGWLKSPANPARATPNLRLASDSLFGKSGGASAGYRVGLKAQRSQAMVAWEQGVPRLPAGARGAIAGPTDEPRPGPLVIPVRTQPTSTRHQVDPAKLKRTTEQLESLLKVVQPEISEVSKGELPRDLIPNLKRIEKLSKQLRRQISP